MANSHKKCKQCKEFVRVEEGVQQPKGFFCTINHAVEWGKAKAQKDYEKQKAKADKKYRKETARLKKTIKKKSEYVKDTQPIFNAFIRARDRKLPCISCGASVEKVEREQGWKTGGAWDAGHFQSRGAKKQLRFNTYNCHKQCKSCNGGGSKYSAKAATVNTGYRANLIKKIGLTKVEELENNNELENQSIEYIERIKKIFKKRTKIYNAIMEY